MFWLRPFLSSCLRQLKIPSLQKSAGSRDPKPSKPVEDSQSYRPISFHCTMVDLTWDTKYFKSTSALCVYIPKIRTRPIGMSLNRTAWVKLNRPYTGVGRFGSSTHKWSLASSANCQWGASEQTADHIILTCPTDRAPRGIVGITVLEKNVLAQFHQCQHLT